MHISRRGIDLRPLMRMRRITRAEDWAGVVTF
jgi:hypothetical protein